MNLQPQFAPRELFFLISSCNMRCTCLWIALLSVWLLTITTHTCAAATLPVYSWKLVHEDDYVYRDNLDGFNWRQIREERTHSRTVWQKAKNLILHSGTFHAPFTGTDDMLPTGTLYIRDPDGQIHRHLLEQGKMTPLSLPDNLQLNGRYLVGARLDCGWLDVDDNGRKEHVFVHAKQLVGHYKNDGVPGSHPAFFFDADDNLTLEIGPALSPFRHRMGGGYQRPHTTYDMEVRYRGKPLSGVTVEITLEGGGWQKTVTTDTNGQFHITPFDVRTTSRHYDKLLYVASYLDQEEQVFHVATLPMFLYRNRPEYTSHLAGYALWTVVGTAATVLLIGFGMYRRRTTRSHAIVSLDKRRIRED